MSALEGVTEEKPNLIGYFEDSFEMEDDDLYKPNKCIDEEIEDLKILLGSLS